MRALLFLTVAGVIAHGVAAAPAADARPEAPRCSADGVSQRHQYRLSGRVRPLLLWTDWHEVGTARLAVSRGGDHFQEIELVVGSDPERAPRRINRWGYVRETLCAGQADVLAIMSKSDEDTLEEATARVSAHADGHPFTAFRSRIVGQLVESEIIRLDLAPELTYRDRQQVLDRLPPPADAVSASMPPGALPGLLTAVSALLLDSASQAGAHPEGVKGLSRTFVNAGKPWQLTQTSVEASTASVDGSKVPVLRATFKARNHVSGDDFEFRTTYGTTGALAGVPIRVTFRPRWWLELELARVR